MRPQDQFYTIHLYFERFFFSGGLQWARVESSPLSRSQSRLVLLEEPHQDTTI